MSTQKLNWKVNTPQLLKEITSLHGAWALVKPLQILGNTLAELSERAIELNDAKLNSVMARLALYDQTDPYSRDYDKETTEEAIRGNFGNDLLKDNQGLREALNWALGYGKNGEAHDKLITEKIKKALKR